MNGPGNQIAQLKDFEAYDEIRKDLEQISAMILHSLLKYHPHIEVKDKTITGFIARTTIALRGVFTLWTIEDEHDGWSIYRSIIDRFLLLNHLAHNDQFLLFDDWIFYNDVRRLNKTKGDLGFKGQGAERVQKLTKNQLERFKRLDRSPPVWRRPKAEAVAKSLNLKFIYDYGYDYASAFVHPISTDGQGDIPTVTGVAGYGLRPKEPGLLHNSLLISTLLIRNGLQFSSFKWAPALYCALSELGNSLAFETTTYHASMLSVANLYTDSSLCTK